MIQRGFFKDDGGHMVPPGPETLIERAGRAVVIRSASAASPQSAIPSQDPAGSEVTARTLVRLAPLNSPENARSASPVQPVARDRLRAAGLIVPGDPPGQLVEELRLVKRRLLQTIERIDTETFPGQARTVMVCSSRPGEGKTFCSINLALSLAVEQDTQVLLIDADFGKPSVCEQLGLSAGQGLLDALADCTLDPETLIVPTDVKGLAVMPGGTRAVDDTERLGSARARQVIAALATADPRRLLIFDSTPALMASPASALALLVGQVVMVVQADRTQESEIRDAVALVDGCPHVGLLLNRTGHIGRRTGFGTYYGQTRA